MNMLKGASQWSIYLPRTEAYIGASGNRFKAVHVCWYWSNNQEESSSVRYHTKLFSRESIQAI